MTRKDIEEMTQRSVAMMAKSNAGFAGIGFFEA